MNSFAPRYGRTDGRPVAQGPQRAEKCLSFTPPAHRAAK